MERSKIIIHRVTIIISVLAFVLSIVDMAFAISADTGSIVVPVLIPIFLALAFLSYFLGGIIRGYTQAFVLSGLL